MKLRQSGLVLIQVLLIFALVAIIASSLLYRQATLFGRTLALEDWSQRQAWLLSGEQLGLAALTNADFDGFDQWFGPFELEAYQSLESQGEIYLLFSDLSGRLNLNWLIPEHPNFDAAKAGLEAITNQVETGEANLLRDIPDWLDPNSSAGFIYERYDPPFSHAGSAFNDASELRLVEGVGRLLMPEITPHISFLPSTSQLNINAVEPDLWAAMMPRIPYELLNQIGEPGSRQLADLILHEDVRNIAREIPQYLLTDQRQYVRLVVMIVEDEREHVLTSIIELLQPDNPIVIRRSQQPDEPLPERELQQGAF